jgi:hypothetical protein
MPGGYNPGEAIADDPEPDGAPDGTVNGAGTGTVDGNSADPLVTWGEDTGGETGVIGAVAVVGLFVEGGATVGVVQPEMTRANSAVANNNGATIKTLLFINTSFRQILIPNSNN